MRQVTLVRMDQQLQLQLNHQLGHPMDLRIQSPQPGRIKLLKRVSGGTNTVVKLNLPSDTIVAIDQMGGIRLKSTAENLQLWEQRIKERVQAGMTIVEWCKYNGVSKYQYHYWNQRVRERQKTGAETTFADITSILSSADTVSQNPAVTFDFQIRFKSFQVSVPSNFNPAALTGLLKVLQAL